MELSKRDGIDELSDVAAGFPFPAELEQSRILWYGRPGKHVYLQRGQMSDRLGIKFAASIGVLFIVGGALFKLSAGVAIGCMLAALALLFALIFGTINPDRYKYAEYYVLTDANLLIAGYDEGWTLFKIPLTDVVSAEVAPQEGDDVPEGVGTVRVQHRPRGTLIKAKAAHLSLIDNPSEASRAILAALSR